MSNLPEKRYTEKEVERAKATSQVVGWVQGAGVVVAGAIVLKFLGWIPALIVLGGVAWVLYKLVSRPEKEPDR